MNLYEVRSEEYEVHRSEFEPPDVGADFEYVVAETHSRARYLTWLHCHPAGGEYIDESPRMRVRILRKGINRSSGIVPDDEWVRALES